VGEETEPGNARSMLLRQVSEAPKDWSPTF